MKKILLFTVIAFFFLGSVALGGEMNLSGCWSVEISEIRSDGVKATETNVLQIIQDEGDNRFWGWVCNLPDEPGRYFSGVVVGKEVYITHWDSATKASLNGKGDELTGINQAFDADERSSKTATATGIKLDDSICLLCPSCINGEKDGDETDIDCGGSCDPCADGLGCSTGDDCQSGVCSGDPPICQAPTCGDGVVNGGEECDDGNEMPDDGCDNCQFECISEGETGSPILGQECCAGLTKDDVSLPDVGVCWTQTDVFICTNCGDGVCGLGENECNCPEDCVSFECIPEGETGLPILGQECCAGLAVVDVSQPGGDGVCWTQTDIFVCTYCGDGVCGLGENECNCPGDCAS